MLGCAGQVCAAATLPALKLDLRKEHCQLPLNPTERRGRISRVVYLHKVCQLINSIEVVWGSPHYFDNLTSFLIWVKETCSIISEFRGFTGHNLSFSTFTRPIVTASFSPCYSGTEFSFQKAADVPSFCRSKRSWK